MITPEALPPSIINIKEEHSSAIDELAGKSIKDVEKELIIKTLEQTGNNITKAAKILGITRQGLQYKLKELNIR